VEKRWLGGWIEQPFRNNRISARRTRRCLRLWIKPPGLFKSRRVRKRRVFVQWEAIFHGSQRRISTVIIGCEADFGENSRKGNLRTLDTVSPS
jgi:hypothetical protein